MNLADQPHRRYNPLVGEWVLVSPHRMKRPWQGKVEQVPGDDLPAYDPKCYLCPGNERVGGHRNPPYEGPFVFDNDFSALQAPVAIPAEANGAEEHPLLRAEMESGICRVVCFSPRHDLTLARMEPEAIRSVVDVWAEQTLELGARWNISNVQIFENRGALMGCSNPHPHGQIWATSSIPNELAREASSFSMHRLIQGPTLLEDYLEEELRREERILFQEDTWVALVPYWAKWPFETLILPRRPVARIPDLTASERDDLARLLQRLTARYDNLFEVSFPYTMGFHQAPTDGQPHPEWHLHGHFYPPLLRSATVQKFMVGFEMLGTPQRDLTPEAAAERLRALPDAHYLTRRETAAR